MKFSSALLLLTPAILVQAATKIAVLEVGVGGTVRRSTSTTKATTVESVRSLWGAVHGRSLQHAGMTVVPDLFHKPDAGVVMSLSGSAVDLADLPSVAALLEEQEAGVVVGQMEVEGSRLRNLLTKLDESAEVEDIVAAVPVAAQKPGLSAVHMTVQEQNTKALDASIVQMIAKVDASAKQEGKTVVLYLVVEEDEAAARRRTVTTSSSHRRLEDNQQADQYQNNQYGGNGENAGYYGYGYWNDYGEWVTPYKTMFQIQYFNVVLWTAIGLSIVLFSTVYMMIYMPLEPDTLLFGESAKMVGDD